MKSASICIIDNNILKGFRNDINYNITNFLNTIGFKINTIVTIPHEKTTIISEVQRLIDSDLVILSAPEVTGCTYDAVAEIFKQRLNPTKENGLAQLSTGLNFTSIFNVYIVPNDWLQLHPVLKQLQRTFLPFNDYLVNYSRFVHISGAHQGKLAEVLDELKDKFDVGVISKQLAEGQRIVLESKNLEEVLQCEKSLKQRLETVGIKQNIWCSMSSVYSLMESTSVIVEAVNVLEKCFSKYKLEEIFLSFNGGKDCTVLLYLTIAVLKKMYPNIPNPQIQCVYIQSSDPFDELNEFVAETIKDYNLPLRIIKGSIRDALEEVLKDEPKYKVSLMGTRRTDPFADTLEHFKMTDSNWPQVMRVNPILEWDYSHVWEFLRTLQIPYCSLYDRGYTSIGNSKNTVFNSALRTKNGYLPAHLLEDGNLERVGRG